MPANQDLETNNHEVYYCQQNGDGTKKTKQFGLYTFGLTFFLFV